MIVCGSREGYPAVYESMVSVGDGRISFRLTCESSKGHWRLEQRAGGGERLVMWSPAGSRIWFDVQ